MCLHHDTHTVFGDQGGMLWFKKEFLGIKLTGNGFVMVNFDCRLDQHLKGQQIHQRGLTKRKAPSCIWPASSH